MPATLEYWSIKQQLMKINVIYEQHHKKTNYYQPKLWLGSSMIDNFHEMKRLDTRQQSYRHDSVLMTVEKERVTQRFYSGN